MNNLIRKIVPESVSRFIKKIVLNGQKYYYHGNSYYCPICNNHFRKLLFGGFDLEAITRLEIIGAGRRQILCPYCQSTDRDRLIFQFLKDDVDIFNQKLKVLHIAPEPSLYSFLKKRKNLIYVTGTKYSEGIYFHQNIDSIDLLQMPFKDGEFDLLICNHVLEHINNDEKAISEIYRVLSPGGKAILQVPISYKIESTYEDFSITSKNMREKHFGQFDHVRVYGIDYITRLEKAGFKVQTYSALDEADKTSMEKVVLNPKEKLFVGHKSSK